MSRPICTKKSCITIIIRIVHLLVFGHRAKSILMKPAIETMASIPEIRIDSYCTRGWEFIGRYHSLFRISPGFHRRGKSFASILRSHLDIFTTVSDVLPLITSHDRDGLLKSSLGVKATMDRRIYSGMVFATRRFPHFSELLSQISHHDSCIDRPKIQGC